MAIALDSTAHPANAGNLLTAKNTGVAFQNIVSPTFSTGAGPILLLAAVMGDGTPQPFPLASMTGASLTWTKRVDFTEATGGWGCQIWSAFSATGSLSSVAVTAALATSSSNQKGALWVIVLNGVASTEAASLGNTGGFFDSVGASTTVNATVTPAASGSWLVGLFGQSDNAATLTADANTSAFDATNAFTSSDWVGFGRYKTSGTVSITTASSAVTFGSSTASLFGFSAAIEVKAAVAFAPDEDFAPVFRQQPDQSIVSVWG